MPDHNLKCSIEPLAVAADTAAALINSSTASLEKDRKTGHLGIPYIKAGKRVLYSLSDLKDWLNTNKVSTASQEVGGCQ